jgi:hypothetical protein
MKIKKRDLSTYSIVFSVFVISVLIFTSKPWRHDNQVICSDVVIYYSYLPATFIFDDIRFEKHETLSKGIFWPEKAPNGNNIIKTSMGMSFLFAPSFFVGHFFAKLLGYPAYGFSEPYKIALLIGAILYLIVGLFFLRKILKVFFSDEITTITIIAMALGTNLTHYASREATMTHLYSFTLFSIFIWGTIRWYKTPRLTSLMLLGALTGLISLIRPTNTLILVFFFLYGVSSWESLIQRIQYFLKHFHWIILMFFAFLLIWIPQFIYWKTITGNFFYFSYKGESFFFNNPQLMNGLFSYRKGWFLYTPLIMLAIIGIPFMFKQIKEVSWAVSIFIVLNIYIVLSWWCWWYGGGFSQRAMVDSYVFLALPFATLLTVAKKAGKYVSYALSILVLVLILHNQYEVEQYKYGAIHYDSMTKAAYWESFGHLHPPGEFWPLLKSPDVEKALKGENEYP